MNAVRYVRMEPLCALFGYVGLGLAGKRLSIGLLHDVSAC